MVIGVSISWALNYISINHSSFLADACDSVFGTFAVHDSLQLMVSQLSYNGLIH